MGKIKSKIGDNVVLHSANRNMQDDIKKCIDKYEVSHANDCINLLQVHGQGGGRTVATHDNYRLDQVFEGGDNTVIINVQKSNLTFCQVVVKPNILAGLDNDVRIILPEEIILQNINQNNVQVKLTLIRNFKNNNTKINQKIKNDISVLLNNFNVTQNYNNFTSGWGRILQNIRALENERKEEFVKKLRSSIMHGLRASLKSNPGRCYKVVYE